MRRLIVATLALVLALGVFAPAALGADGVNVTVNVQQVNFIDQQPVIVDGRTFLPRVV